MGFLSLFSKQGLRLRVPSLLVLTAAAFTLWSFLSYFWSIAPTASFNRSQTYAQLLLVTFLVWQLCRNNKQLRALLQALFGVPMSHAPPSWLLLFWGFRLLIQAATQV